MELERLERCILCGGMSIDMLGHSDSLYGCNDCGHVFNNPRPAAGAVKEYYSSSWKYDSWLEEEAGREALIRRRLRILLKYKNGGSLLDIGAGTGQFLSHAGRYYLPVYGTEVSGSAVKIAGEKYGISIQQGAIEECGYGDSTFDIITMFHVLEHVPYPGNTIIKCRGLLTDKGILVVAVPNDLNSLRTKVKRFLGKTGVSRFREINKAGMRPIKLDGSEDEIHLSHFSADTLKRYLNKSGFKVVGCRLDPYYSYSGLKGIAHNGYYIFCSILKSAFGINIYDTLWLVAVK